MNRLFRILVLIISLQAAAQRREGDSLFAAGNYKEAINRYKNTAPDAYNSFQIARVYNQLGDVSKALENYQIGLALDSVNVTAQFEYGKMLLSANKKQDAHSIFKSLVSKQAGVATYHYYLGKCEVSLNSHGAGIPHFERAVRLNPEYITARVDLVTHLILTNDFTKAIAISQQGLKLNPDLMVFHSLLGQGYYLTNDFKNAITHFKIVDEAGLLTEGLLKMLGAACYQNGLYEDSISYYTRANEDFSPSSASHLMIAKSYVRVGNFQQALSNVNSAIALKRPGLNQEYLQMATIYYEMKDDKRMLDYLIKAKNEDPNDGVSAYQYCQAYDRLYTDKTAKINNYTDFVQRFPNDPYAPLAKARINDLTRQRFLETKKE